MPFPRMSKMPATCKLWVGPLLSKSFLHVDSLGNAGWRKVIVEVRLEQLGITWQPQVSFNTYLILRHSNGTQKAQMAT